MTDHEGAYRDVVAHMAGVCDDVANGNMSGVATDAWTEAQVVDERRDWDLDRVLDDWADHAGAVDPILNEIGQPIGQTAGPGGRRAVTERRSLAQVQALECDGPALDATMFDNAFLTPAPRDIVE